MGDHQVRKGQTGLRIHKLMNWLMLKKHVGPISLSCILSSRCSKRWSDQDNEGVTQQHLLILYMYAYAHRNGPHWWQINMKKNTLQQPRSWVTPPDRNSNQWINLGTCTKLHCSEKLLLLYKKSPEGSRAGVLCWGYPNQEVSQHYSLPTVFECTKIFSQRACMPLPHARIHF